MMIQPVHDQGRLSVQDCRRILDRWWGGRQVDSIRVIKGIKGGQGVIFDIYEDQFDRFMDNYDHICQQEGDRLDFVVERCQELPELAEDDPNIANSWRTTDSDFDAGQNNQRGGYGNRGGYRGSNQGYSDYGNRGGGQRGMRGNRGGGGYGQRDDFQPQLQKHSMSYEPESSWRNERSDNQDNFRGGGGRGFRGQNNQYRGGNSDTHHAPQQREQQNYQKPQLQYQQKSRQSNNPDEQVSPQQITSVFVANLPNDFTEQQMLELFKTSGLQPVKAKLLQD